MAYYSRTPRNHLELEQCVDLLRHSPFGRNPSIGWGEFTDAWERILVSGMGAIDVEGPLHNNITKIFEPILKNAKLGATNPHYLHGHLAIYFNCHLNASFVKEFVAGNYGDEPLLFVITRLYRDAEFNRKGESPLAAVDEKNKLLAPTCFATFPVVHPAVTIWNPLVLAYVGGYTERMIKSGRQELLGVPIGTIMFPFHSREFISAYRSFGIPIFRELTEHEADLSDRDRIYLGLFCRDRATCDENGVPHEHAVLDGGYFGIYRQFFEFELAQQRSNLTKQRQMVCHLLRQGYSDDDIAFALGNTRSGDPYRADTVSEIMNHCYNKLCAAGYESRESKKGGGSVRARLTKLINQHSVSHEFGQYLFSTYPWPATLDTRP